MAGWYVRRGEKVVGPVEVSRLKELAAEGKLVPTDQLAKDAAGPWTAASSTSLFREEPIPGLQGPQVQPESAHQITPAAGSPAVEQLPIPHSPSTESTAGKVIRKGLTTLTNVGRGALYTGGAASRWFAVRSKRRHEIKLAKIHAQGLVDSQRLQTTAQASARAAVTTSPQLVQTTVVKVVNRNNGGCGCSGCGLILLLIVLGVIAALIYSGMNPSPP